MKTSLPRTALLLLSFALLSSCLSVETRVELSDAQRGELTYIYTVERDLLEAEVFDREAENWPIPIARRDFQLFADAIPGAELKQYAREDSEQRSVVTARYSFESIEDLRRLLSMRESPSIEPGEGEFGLRFQLTPLGVAGLTEGEREFLQSYLRESSFSFTVTTPEPIVSTSQGEAQGRTLSVEHSLQELLDRPEPLFLELSW